MGSLAQISGVLVRQMSHVHELPIRLRVRLTLGIDQNSIDIDHSLS